MWSLESIIYNFDKSSTGVFATWQVLELWMLVGSGFGMVNFGVGRGQGGLISSNIGVDLLV